MPVTVTRQLFSNWQYIGYPDLLEGNSRTGLGSFRACKIIAGLYILVPNFFLNCSKRVPSNFSKIKIEELNSEGEREGITSSIL